jgi:hypothetical protein
MVDYVLMNHFRIKYSTRFPPKLFDLLDGCLLDELRIFDTGGTLIFNTSLPNDNLSDAEWWKQLYNSHNYVPPRTKSELLFIPVGVYELDPLDKVLNMIEKYPDYGKGLPPGHQSVIVRYQHKYYYYDPEDCCSHHLSFLRQTFHDIVFIGDAVQQNDNFCMLHVIHFMIQVWRNPKRLLQRGKKRNVYQRLTDVCKFLI